MSALSLRAVVARINRRLHKEDKQLHRARSGVMLCNFGPYYVRDWRRNMVTQSHVDPEELAREMNLIHPYEEVTK